MPFDWDEADGNAREEAPFVKAVCDVCHGIDVAGEFDSLEEGLAACYLADIGDQCFAQGEEDVAVLVGVLEDGVAAVVLQLPSASVDGFGIAIGGGVGGDEVEAI